MSAEAWGLRSVVRNAVRLIVVAALVSTVTASTVPIGRGPKPREGCGSPTLTGPAFANVGDTYSITGCGFEPGQLVPFVGGEAGGCCWSVNMVADSGGAFLYQGPVWAAGTYMFKALESTRNSWRTAATWTFEAT